MKTIDEFDGSPACESPLRAEREAFQNDTCLALYLRDIGRMKRLTPQEETDLGTRTRKGDRDAREHLIKANLALVITIAKGYQGIGLPLLDLISEGNIGLVRAVERFDPSKGAKLSGYSAFWIKQAICHALASQSKAMRLPTHVAGKLGKMHRAASRFEEQFGREPTDDELAAKVGTTPLRVTQMRMAGMRPASLDAQIDGHDIGSYGDTIADEKAESPYEELEGKTLTGMMHRMIQTLDEREQDILRLRFGFGGELPKTLHQIGEELGLSSERVRQLQKAALKKLHRRIKNLEENLPCRRAVEVAPAS